VLEYVGKDLPPSFVDTEDDDRGRFAVGSCSTTIAVAIVSEMDVNLLWLLFLGGVDIGLSVAPPAEVVIV